MRGRRFLTAAAIVTTFALAGVIGSGSFLANAAGSNDSCGYPVSGSTAPRGTLATVEPTTLPAFRPAKGGAVAPGSTMQAFFTDEHAMTLGTAKVIVGTTTTTYSPTPFVVTDTATHTGSSTSVNEGATIAQGGKDAQGRPLGPELYITDTSVAGAVPVPTTTADPAGDWQATGTDGAAPDAVFGTWKNAVVTNGVPADPADPTANTVLGPGADPLPTLNNDGTTFHSGGFVAEARWVVGGTANAPTLGGVALVPGHTYRLQFQIHDGDHGLDSGEACTTINIPSVSTVATGDTIHTDGTANVSDTATVGGVTAPLPSGLNQVEFKVYGPDPTPGTDNTDDCSGSPQTRNVTLNSTTPSGAYPSGNFTVNAPGDYHFTADLRVGGTIVARSLCDATNETAHVGSRPTSLTTDARNPNSADGTYSPTTTLSDVATLSGGTTNAGGTLTFTLYADNGSGGCAATALGSTQVTVNAGANGAQYTGTLTSTALTPSLAFFGAGTYHWSVSYGGDPVTGNDPSSDGVPCPATDTSTNHENPVINSPHISITKNPDPQTIEAAGNGELTPAPGVTPGKASWTLHVTNDGNTDLTNVVVTDPNAPNCAQNVGNLAKGASVDVLPAQCFITGLTTANWTTAGKDPNRADVSGHAGAQTVTDHDTASVTIINPHIEVTKTPPSQSVALGGIAHFTITVTNNGDVSLSDVIVTDALAQGCAATFDGRMVGGKPTKTVAGLASMPKTGAGSSVTYSCDSDPVNAPFTNAVGACGKDVLNGVVCDDDNNNGTPNSDCTTAGGFSADQCAGVGIDSLSSVQDFKPKDTGTVSFNGPHNAPNGVMNFTLYKGSCVPAHQIYQQLGVAVNGSGVASTASADYLSTLITTANGLPGVSVPAGTAGTYNWQISYVSDTNGNADVIGACGTENFVVTNG